jgi:hypothetical protein
VTASPESLGHDIMPHLPMLLLDPSWRGIYVNAAGQKAASEAFSIQMPKDPEKWSAELETLRAFHFDVVTVDLTGNTEKLGVQRARRRLGGLPALPGERGSAPDLGGRNSLGAAPGDGRRPSRLVAHPLHF